MFARVRLAVVAILISYEDVIVITDKGYENFTDFLPVELDDIEKLVGSGGMLEQFPPGQESKGTKVQ